MMWIIASVPFWLLGGVIMSLGLIGGGLCIKTDCTGKDMMETAAGFVIFMLAAGLFFAIAAKVAS